MQILETPEGPAVVIVEIC
jgi:hypothetical protein